jgi:hypothetical protein
MEFVAACVRQRKPVVAFADAGEVSRQIGQVLRDEMDDLAFPLDAACTAIMPAARMMRRWRSHNEDDAALALVQ